jgi:hypothetical protein
MLSKFAYRRLYSLQRFALPFLPRWNHVDTANIESDGPSPGLNLMRRCYHAGDWNLHCGSLGESNVGDSA